MTSEDTASREEGAEEGLDKSCTGVYNTDMMSKVAALVEARRRWGREGIVRYDKRALTEADKAPLRPILEKLRAEKKPETATERSTLSWKLLAHRCQVGVINCGAGIAMFSVRGSGDTWEEAFAKADRK